MSRRAPFMPLFGGDYHGSTQHMDQADEHGAYLLILMTMWEKGGSLPNSQDMLRKIAKVKPQRWPAVWLQIGPLFTVEGEIITQTRLREERDYVTETSRVRSIVGQRGGRAKSLKYKKTPVAIAKQLSGKRVPPTPTVEERDLKVSLSSTPSERRAGDPEGRPPSDGPPRGKLLNQMTREERLAVVGGVIAEGDARRRRRREA